MSADNIIYIQQKGNKHRVWEQSASVDPNPKYGQDSHSPTFKEFNSEQEAFTYAFDLNKEWQTEYGVSKLEPSDTEEPDISPGVIFEKTLEHPFVREIIFNRHEHEIYTLLIVLKFKDIECYRGSDDVYVLQREDKLEQNKCETHTLQVPEILETEKLADCYVYHKHDKDQIEYIWIPCSIFDEE